VPAPKSTSPLNVPPMTISSLGPTARNPWVTPLPSSIRTHRKFPYVSSCATKPQAVPAQVYG
jgi:hypothetical protein